MSTAASKLVPPSTQNVTSDLDRHRADYHPTLWSDYFLKFASESMEVDDGMRKHIEILKEEVRNMLVPASEKSLTKVKLIDSIQRLGVFYHFESEIDQVLEQIHKNYVKNDKITHNYEDLNSLALLFRLLRQHGYPVSPDVFKKFKDTLGNFRETLTSDLEGMLSLYEAAHLSIHGEDILDEALAFTSTHLQSLTTHCSPLLAAQVHHSLRQSLHRGLPRLEARYYISIYQQDPSHNEVLLKLAKLDFNMLQKLHQKEFGNISKWWIKDFDVPRNLSYARDRVAECCFWILAVYFEPHYSLARRIMTKVIALLSIIDDTYDAYGKLDELELFTVAIERWDPCCLDDLPEYMKLTYKALLNAFEEIEKDMTKEGRAYSVDYTKKELKKMVQAYMNEARWFNSKYKPTTEEYISISTVSCGYPLLSTTSFIGMGDIVTEDIFKWAENSPKIFKASSVLCRVMDDIVSSEFEQKRGHVSSLVECYMKDNGVSREEAINELGKLVRNAWKDINEECLKPTEVPMPFLMRVLNLARFIDVFYKDADNYTNAGGLMKDSIVALLVDPLPI